MLSSTDCHPSPEPSANRPWPPCRIRSSLHPDKQMSRQPAHHQPVAEQGVRNQDPRYQRTIYVEEVEYTLAHTTRPRLPHDYLPSKCRLLGHIPDVIRDLFAHSHCSLADLNDPHGTDNSRNYG